MTITLDYDINFVDRRVFADDYDLIEEGDPETLRIDLYRLHKQNGVITTDTSWNDSIVVPIQELEYVKKWIKLVFACDVDNEDDIWDCTASIEDYALPARRLAPITRRFFEDRKPYVMQEETV
jgi:hypothetical protein